MAFHEEEEDQDVAAAVVERGVGTMTTVSKPRAMQERDHYTSTPLIDIRTMQNKLYDLAENEEYTETTRRLALDEANYLEDIVAFRLQPVRRRRALHKAGRLPWLGTWTREELVGE